ncbi:hypothetical protein VTH82DRAFT_5514 [Thermothelomyces myriococcoides]
MAPNPELRRQVIAIYKRKSPLANSPKSIKHTTSPIGYVIKCYDFFRPRLHRAFMAKAHLTDEKEIREAIARAEFVRKEIEAL